VKSPTIPSYKADFTPEEEIIGNTFYDLQTNSSMQNRIHIYPDGTMAGVWTLGFDFPSFAGDRGTGYNYYDGTAWGPYPTERIESDRTGWPCYAPYGENGEIILAHNWTATGGGDGLFYNIREEKGTGDWTEYLFQGPTGNEDLAWPRMTTTGVNNSVMHFIAITKPSGNNNRQ